MNLHGKDGGNTRFRFDIIDSAIGEDKSQINLADVIKPIETSSGHKTNEEAWDILRVKMGITLIATISGNSNPTATDAGDFLKSTELESGGTNAGSGYTLQLKKDLIEGWYAIYENRYSKPSYHIFYLARNSEYPIYNINGEPIAVLANTTLNIESLNFETTQLHYFSPKQMSTVKVNGLKPYQAALYDTGSVLRHEDPVFLSEEICKIISLFAGLLIFIILFMYDISAGNISFKKKPAVKGIPVYDLPQI